MDLLKSKTLYLIKRLTNLKDTNDYLSNSINKNFYLTDNDLDNTIFNQYYNDQEVIRLVDEIFKEKKFNYKIDECYRVLEL